MHKVASDNEDKRLRAHPSPVDLEVEKSSRADISVETQEALECFVVLRADGFPLLDIIEWE